MSSTTTCSAPFHASWKAFARGCTCPAPSYTKWRAYKDRDNAKRADQLRGKPKPTGIPQPRFPQVREAGPASRLLWERDDRACLGSPLSVWFPVGVPTRLQALAVLGWSSVEVAERIGCSPENVKSLRNDQRNRVRIATWRAVDQLYRELSDTTGPSRITALRSRRAGWLPPIQWDDDALDDPAGRPGHRRRAQPVELTGDRHTDILAMTDADWTGAAIAARLGITERCVDRHRQQRREAS